MKIAHVTYIESDSLSCIQSSIESCEVNCIAQVNWADYPYCPEVTFRVAHNNNMLFVDFSVVEDHIKAQWLNNNELGG